MAYSKDSKSAAVRARLDHPVIDGDGHWLEPVPIFLDYLRQVAGPSVADRFVKKQAETGWYEWSREERRDRRLHRPTWWGEPANTLDRATAMVPRLFHERLDDFGIDFCLLYTSLGLFHVGNPDEELRRACARAVNRMNAEMFAPYRCPHCARRGGARAYAAGGHRGGDLRGARAGHEGHHDREPRQAAGAGGGAGGEPIPRTRATSSTLSRWTARTTTTPSGRSASSSRWR